MRERSLMKLDLPLSSHFFFTFAQTYHRHLTRILYHYDHSLAILIFTLVFPV